MASDLSRKPTLGLWGATGIGVAAIVGGGILALAGVAFSTTGPSAVLAFGLNGVIALLTAASFAEVATRFPESGGTYVYAKKVLSVEAAFSVGWVVWFASIAASVLYAIGFGAFASLSITSAFAGSESKFIEHMGTPWAIVVLGVASTAFYTLSLSIRGGGAGTWTNVSKLSAFIVLILAGVWMVTGRTGGELRVSFQPFFSHGPYGLVKAMGFTFIALQGFDLIATVAGNIREPRTTIPRSMFLSLGIALLIYIPLLLIVTAVGVPNGETLASVSASSQEALIAVAAQNYLGVAGYWIVLAAGVFSMLSALQANLLASSHIASAMARDRLLPQVLSPGDMRHGAPKAALYLTTAITIALMLLVPNVQAAGAAASLIFLISFALVHCICVLVRLRTDPVSTSFRAPLFPLVPVLGGLSCMALAVFQALAVPSAGKIAVGCMGVGGLLFIFLFARRARVADAFSTAIDPEGIRLRGRSPLVLVPIANPENTAGMVSLANALTPPQVGRVLLLSIVTTVGDSARVDMDTQLTSVHQVMQKALSTAKASGARAEILVTLAADPWKEIARIGRAQECSSLLLGLTSATAVAEDTPLNAFLSTTPSDVVILRAPPGWHPDEALRILVPVGGRGVNERLLARLIGSLLRVRDRQITFLRVVAETTDKRHVADERSLRQTARDIGSTDPIIRFEKGDALDAISTCAESYDLLILGVQRHAGSSKLFGGFALEVARRTTRPMMIINQRV